MAQLKHEELLWRMKGYPKDAMPASEERAYTRRTAEVDREELEEFHRRKRARRRTLARGGSKLSLAQERDLSRKLTELREQELAEPGVEAARKRTRKEVLDQKRREVAQRNKTD